MNELSEDLCKVNLQMFVFALILNVNTTVGKVASDVTGYIGCEVEVSRI